MKIFLASGRTDKETLATACQEKVDRQKHLVYCHDCPSTAEPRLDARLAQMGARSGVAANLKDFPLAPLLAQLVIPARHLFQHASVLEVIHDTTIAACVHPAPMHPHHVSLRPNLQNSVYRSQKMSPQSQGGVRKRSTNVSGGVASTSVTAIMLLSMPKCVCIFQVAKLGTAAALSQAPRNAL